MNVWWLASVTPVILGAALTGREWLMTLATAYGVVVLAWQFSLVL